LRVHIRIILTVMGLALSACLSPSDCFREDVFCAALVTDTQGIEDHGVHADAWAGLQQAQKDGLADRVEYIASVDARDYSKNIAYFSEQGFDVIFTSGISLDDETLQNTDLYPDSVFVGLNQAFEESRPNLISITFAEDQMGFAAGVVAARITKTKIVAAVCETSGIDAMWRYCEGFRAGVKFADEDVKALVVYRENGDREKLFLDETWGYETASSLVLRGTDVIFAAGGVTGQGALRAATKQGVYAIGTERDQSAAMAESGSRVVVSFYGQPSFEVREVMRVVKDGRVSFERAGRVQFNLSTHALSPDLEAELLALLEELGNGNVVTTVSKSR